MTGVEICLVSSLKRGDKIALKPHPTAFFCTRFEFALLCTFYSTWMAH